MRITLSRKGTRWPPDLKLNIENAIYTLESADLSGASGAIDTGELMLTFLYLKTVLGLPKNFETAYRSGDVIKNMAEKTLEHEARLPRPALLEKITAEWSDDLGYFVFCKRNSPPFSELNKWFGEESQSTRFYRDSKRRLSAIKWGDGSEWYVGALFWFQGTPHYDTLRKIATVPDPVLSALNGRGEIVFDFIYREVLLTVWRDRRWGGWKIAELLGDAASFVESARLLIESKGVALPREFKLNYHSAIRGWKHLNADKSCCLLQTASPILLRAVLGGGGNYAKTAEKRDFKFGDVVILMRFLGHWLPYVNYNVWVHVAITVQRQWHVENGDKKTASACYMIPESKKAAEWWISWDDFNALLPSYMTAESLRLIDSSVIYDEDTASIIANISAGKIGEIDFEALLDRFVPVNRGDFYYATQLHTLSDVEEGADDTDWLAVYGHCVWSAEDSASNGGSKADSTDRVVRSLGKYGKNAIDLTSVRIESGDPVRMIPAEGGRPVPSWPVEKRPMVNFITDILVAGIGKFDYLPDKEWNKLKSELRRRGDKRDLISTIASDLAAKNVLSMSQAVAKYFEKNAENFFWARFWRLLDKEANDDEAAVVVKYLGSRGIYRDSSISGGKVESAEKYSFNSDTIPTGNKII